MAIQPDGQIQADGQILEGDDLQARLTAVGEAGAVTIYAGVETPSEALARLMQQAREAGVEDVRMAFSGVGAK